MATDELRCHQIRIHDDRLEGLRGDRPLVALPLVEVRRVRIATGRIAERPIVQIVLGLALTAVGIVCLLLLLRWIAYGRDIGEVTLLMLGWLVAGPAIVFGAVRRGLIVRARGILVDDR